MFEKGTALQNESGRKDGGLYFLSIIVILAALLRFGRLDQYSIWLDETIQYAGSKYQITELYNNIFPQEMPLSFFLGKVQNAWGFDSSIFRLRLSSVFAGVLLVPVMYFTARTLFDLPTSIMTSLLIALAPCLIQYSQEYRMYAYFILFTNTAGLCLISFVKNPAIDKICAFICLALMSIYDHFLGVVAVAALMAYGGVVGLVQMRRAFDVLAGLVAAGFVICSGMILSIPMWVRFLRDEYVPDQGMLFNLRGFKTIFGVFLGVGDGAVFWTLLVFAVVGLLLACRQNYKSFLYVAAFVFIPLIILSIRGSGRVFISNRYLVFIEPVYLMACAHGISASCRNICGWIGSRYLPLVYSGAICAVIIVFIAPLNFLYNNNVKNLPPDLRGAYNFLLSEFRSDDVVVEASTSHGGSPYYYRFYDAYFLNNKQIDRTVVDTLNLPSWLSQHKDARGQVWFLLTVDRHEQELIEKRNSILFRKSCFDLICVFKLNKMGVSIPRQVHSFLEEYNGLEPTFGNVATAITPILR